MQDLFTQFEKAKSSDDKQRIVDDAILELEVHAKIEEEIFYPMVRQEVGLEEVMVEADEEHHVVKVLIDELMGMSLTTSTTTRSSGYWQRTSSIISRKRKLRCSLRRKR